MIRVELTARGLILGVLVAIFAAVGSGAAAADPVVTPFGPGSPVPNPTVFPWEGGGSSVFTPNSEFAPDLQTSGGDARQDVGGEFGIFCNNQAIVCQWGSS